MDFFSNKSKLKRVAAKLKRELVSLQQYSGSYYIKLRNANGEHGHPLNEDSVFKVNCWFVEKKDFHWWPLYLTNRYTGCVGSVDALYLEDYYKDKQRYVSSLVTELALDKPNYKTIRQLIERIKTDEPLGMQTQLHIRRIDKFTGEHWLMNLLGGFFGVVYALLLCLKSLWLIPDYYNGKSAYCGSSEFFYDTAIYFCESIWKIISSIIFPLAIIQSKCQTDSYNPFTKGSVMRCLEAIDALAGAELANQPPATPNSANTFPYNW